MNVQSFLNNGDPAILLGAVITVRQQLEKQVRLETKVHSDRWVNHSRFRDDLLQQIRQSWSNAQFSGRAVFGRSGQH